jgi:hypothetical protein
MDSAGDPFRPLLRVRLQESGSHQVTPLVADQMLGKDSGKIKKLAKASITLSLPV